MWPMILLGTIFTIGGAVAVLAAMLNWDWFFSTASARSVGAARSRMMGRIFYGIFGVLLAAAGLYLVLSLK